MPESDTRDKLIEAAMRLFHEQGYAGTAVATILREAGVNAGSLYHFFPAKEELLVAVLERYAELLQPVVLGPREEAEADPIARVFLLLDWYREGLAASGCRMGCPIGNLALEMADDHPRVREKVDENFRNWAAGIERWLDAAGERLPASVDHAALARFVLTVMEGGIMLARAQGSLAAYDASVAVLRDYFDLLLEQGGPTTRVAAPEQA